MRTINEIEAIKKEVLNQVRQLDYKYKVQQYESAVTSWLVRTILEVGDAVKREN